MVPYNVEDANATFDSAIRLLSGLTQSSTDEVEKAKITLVSSVLTCIKGYSASSNGIPALRGFGYEEGIKLAQDILDEGLNLRGFRFNYSKILEAIFS